MNKNIIGDKNPNFKHGGKGTRIYSIWKDIKKRCENPNSISYPWYGGIGIKRCEDWSSFMNFRDWSFENGYDESLTIDRIDSKGDYEPSNCRWVTQEFQKSNTKSNRYISYLGVKYHVAFFAKTFNFTNSRVIYLLNKGLTPEQIIQNGKI